MRFTFARQLLFPVAVLCSASAAVAQCAPVTAGKTDQAVSLTGNAATTLAANSIIDTITQAIIQTPVGKQPTPDASSNVGVLSEAALTATCFATGGQSTAQIAANQAPTVASSAQKFLSAVTDTTQTQTQVGAPSPSNAATSPTEKPGIPALLGIAVENGAVSESTTSSTMTLSTTLYGLFSGFRGDNDSVYNACPQCVQLGGSATFNLASTSDPLSEATRKQISQWQIKYSFRDTSSRAHLARDLYRTVVGSTGDGLAAAQSNRWMSTVLPTLNWDVKNAQLNGDDLVTAMTKLVQAKLPAPATATTVLADADKKALVNTLLTTLEKDQTFINDLQRALQNAPVATAAAAIAAATKAMILADSHYATAAGLMANGWDGALTFGQQFPTQSTTSPTATDYLVATGIISFQPGEKAGQYVNKLKANPTATSVLATSKWQPTMTTNLMLSMYTNPLASANETTFRGGGASVQSEWKLGKSPFDSDPLDKSMLTLSFSGNYNRLQENQHQASKKADIVLGTLKFEIPIAAGISFPLSFSVANATALVKETYVKGNFGVSFDLSTLESLLKAKGATNP